SFTTARRKVSTYWRATAVHRISRPCADARAHIALRPSSSRIRLITSDAIALESLHGTRMPRPPASSSRAYVYGVEMTALPAPAAYASVPDVIWPGWRYGVM